ncbi:MAG: hypothetical protein ABII09_03575 [Planctomycetota bacterium]
MAFTGTPTLRRLRVIKAIIETNRGEFVAPTQAGHVYDLKMESNSEYIDRKGTGLYRGHQFQGAQGEATGKVTFRTELKGDGAHHLDAFDAILLQACGLVKATEVYSVHSGQALDETISIAGWQDGLKKMMQGAMGNVRISGEHGKPVYLECDFDGFWLPPTGEAMPAWTPSTVQPILFDGGAVTVATNAMKLSRFEIDLGIKPVNMSGDYFGLADYDIVLTIDPLEYLVADKDWHGIKLAETESAVSIPITDGTDIITITMPKVQIKQLGDAEREGFNSLDLTGECHHSAGNDALSIAVT